MKADPKAQRELLDVVALDLRLGQLSHRLGALPEAGRLAEAKAAAQAASDEVAVVAMRLEDMDREIAKREGDVAAVRQREDRDKQLLASGSLEARTQNDVQHELSSLRKRRKAFEDELLGLLERREEEQAALAAAQARRDVASAAALASAHTLDEAQARLQGDLRAAEESRKDRAAGLPEELLGLYERLRARGAAAGQLDGRRCGACRLELTPAEMSRIVAARPDEVVRCPECEAIVVRTGS